jgi:hypothetical protein
MMPRHEHSKEFEDLLKKTSRNDKEIGVLILSKQLLTEGIKFFSTNAVMDEQQLDELVRSSREKALKEIGV